MFFGVFQNGISTRVLYIELSTPILGLEWNRPYSPENDLQPGLYLAN